MTVLCVLLAGLVLLVSVPVAVLAAQVLLALPAWRERSTPAGRRPRLAVMVPAHDEASGIAATLASILPQLCAGDRLLVVADNCSDDTAEIASKAGAEVIERMDTERRGKGYALDFGVRHLAMDAPEVVVVVDADCQVAAGSINRLARLCREASRPVQALDLMRSPQGASLKTRLGEFAWLVKNQVRPLGFLRLGLPCPLMGTGMAFPWPLLERAALASGHLVEDLKLGIELARSGTPPLFCPEARVSSYFPVSTEGIENQRTRWEHGHLGVIAAEAPGLLADALRRRSIGLFALVLDLCVPPLALLALLVVSLVLLSAAFSALGGSQLPLALAFGAMVVLGLTVLLAWARYGRQAVSFVDLAYSPLYALRKIPLYLKFLSNRQTEWVRSKRDGR